MDAPVAGDGASIDAAKVSLLQAVRPLALEDVVRGQYRGYRSETGVAPDSNVETYVAARLSVDARVVLLGSIASDKYVKILQAAFGERLIFPAAFVGRGDMSRGGMLLRAVDEGRELEYVPIAGSVRRGSRPGKLPPRSVDKTEGQRDRKTE